MLKLTSCSAGYGPNPVFENVSIEVSTDSVFAVIGRSGCGKTTLLSVAAGLRTASSGTVLVRGIPVGQANKRVGYVLQEPGLLPWYSVAHNVALGLCMRGEKRRSKAVKRRVEDVLHAVGMRDAAKHHPNELSGGERQRVSLARTLILDPDVLLLDEPFSALDALTRETLQELLLSVLAQRRVACVLVTHSIDEAVYLGDRVAIMHGSPAGITEVPAWTERGARAAAGRSDPAFLAACASVRSEFESLQPEGANR